jgi:hypothetical protein
MFSEETIENKNKYNNAIYERILLKIKILHDLEIFRLYFYEQSSLLEEFVKYIISQHFTRRDMIGYLQQNNNCKCHKCTDHFIVDICDDQILKYFKDFTIHNIINNILKKIYAIPSIVEDHPTKKKFAKFIFDIHFSELCGICICKNTCENCSISHGLLLCDECINKYYVQFKDYTFNLEIEEILKYGIEREVIYADIMEDIVQLSKYITSNHFKGRDADGNKSYIGECQKCKDPLYKPICFPCIDNNYIGLKSSTTTTSSCTVQEITPTSSCTVQEITP